MAVAIPPFAVTLGRLERGLFNMPDRPPEELSPQELAERQRVLRLMESQRGLFSDLHLWQRLFDKIQFGADPADLDYEKNWLIP